MPTPNETSNLKPAIIGALSVIVAALIAGAVAIINNRPITTFGCLKDYTQYELKEGEELRYIAKRNNHPLDDWKLILNPTDGKPYNSDQAKNLQASDRVCLPKGWK